MASFLYAIGDLLCSSVGCVIRHTDSRHERGRTNVERTDSIEEEYVASFSSDVSQIVNAAGAAELISFISLGLS